MSIYLAPQGEIKCPVQQCNVIFPMNDDDDDELLSNTLKANIWQHVSQLHVPEFEEFVNKYSTATSYIPRESKVSIEMIIPQLASMRKRIIFT